MRFLIRFAYSEGFMDYGYACQTSSMVIEADSLAEAKSEAMKLALKEVWPSTDVEIIDAKEYAGADNEQLGN